MSVSPPNPSEVVVRHNIGARRFETMIDGHLAIADYELDGNRMIFTHTFVPPELRGRGIAEKLVRPALELARAEQRIVVPACSYVAAFIQRHPEFKELVE